MERLSDFAADIVNDLYENSDWYGDRSLIEAAINRLAAIEDILGAEYDLDELGEVIQAKQEGRCVVLKCKPNATVWFIKSAFSSARFPIEGNHVSIKGFACDGDIYCSAITAYNKISRSFYMSDIGKTVFLTREEAEAALRREQNEKGGSSE